MSKLISTYAAATGLHIDRVNVKSQFYPLPFDRFITIQTGSGQGAKNYDMWQEVVVLLKSVIDTGITIVHLGTKDDPPLQGVHDLRGKTNIQQSHYLIQRGLLHLGNDSWLAHCKGWNRGPLITLFGSTSEQNHSAYWYDPMKTSFISSHRFGGNPTYSSQENPKTINLIPPEKVVNSVVGLLGVGTPLTQQTRMFGLLYSHVIFELVPNVFPAPSFMPEAPISVRMDYLFNESVLVNLIKTGRKVSIITDKPLNLNLLGQYRPSILNYTHQLSDDCPLQYVANLRNIIPNHTFFTKEKDDTKVAALRFKYFDVCTIERANDITREDYLKAALTYLNWGEEKRVDLLAELEYGKVRFKSNKYVLSDGSMFLSKAHWLAKQPMVDPSQNGGTVIDSPDFWTDINHTTIYYQP